MSTAELEAEVARLKAKLAKKNTLSIKASEKGGVSVYGLGRFPVTLYPEQMTRLIEHGPAILDFIETNKARLKFKED